VRRLLGSPTPEIARERQSLVIPVAQSQREDERVLGMIKAVEGDDDATEHPSCLIELEDEQFVEPASRPAARNRDVCRRAGVTDDRTVVIDGEQVASPRWLAGPAEGDVDAWVVGWNGVSEDDPATVGECPDARRECAAGESVKHV
jgi:hypothetical protein